MGDIAGFQNLSIDGNVVAANIVAGTYTPTIIDGDNVASSGNSTGKYQRIGDIVYVTTRTNITPTAADTLTSYTVSLPIASTFSTMGDVFGAGGRHDGRSSAGVGADTTNDAAEVRFTSTTNTNVHYIFVLFAYEVI